MGQVKSVYILILLNYLIYGLSLIFPLQILALNTYNVEFYQFITSFFYHFSFEHISGNMFFIYFFGRLIEEQLGDKTFLNVYLLSGLTVNGIEYILNIGQPMVLGGASGVVYALFSISLFVRPKKSWQSWVEVVVLLPFVISHTLTELSLLGQNDTISHSSHLLGAIIGTVIYFIIIKRKK